MAYRNDWISLINSLAPKYGVDPNAALAVARGEGLSGDVGDEGHAFGPFQMNDAGGVLTGRFGSSAERRAYAESPAGIEEAIRAMAAAGARGLTGNAAIAAIIRNYERPADPEGSIARATGGARVAGTAPNPAPNPYAPTAPGFDPAQFDALKAAILGAQNIQTPTSPLGAAPELANLYKSSFQLPQSEIATKAIGKIGQAQLDYQEKAKAKAEQLEEDMRDYAKYEKRQKADGGYDFFDPLGNQVDIATLSQRTGKRPAEILQYSENPKDRQFVRDYEGLFEYGQAFYDKAADPSDEKSKAIIDRYNESDERLNKLYKEFGAKPPDEYLGKLRELFHKTYKRYYVPSYQEPAPALRDTIFSRRAGPFTIPRYQSPNKPLFANPQNFTYDESDYVI